MADKCACLEVWRDIFFIIPSEMWFDTYIGTDGRDLANGYPLFTYISPLIDKVPFTVPQAK